MKRAILLLFAVLAMAMAFVPSSVKSALPIDLPAVDIMSTLAAKEKLETTLADNKVAINEANAAKQTYQNAEAAFASQRTIEISYNDVGRMYQLLSNVQGVSFRNLYQADPDANWAKGMELNVQDYIPAGEMEAPAATLPPAVCMVLVVEDIPQGLAVVDRLSLPVCQIVTSAPGTIEVTFLTGGGN